MARKIDTKRARRTRKFWGDSDAVIGSINEIRKSGPLKDCEGPQIYDIKGLNGPWQFLLILTPVEKSTYVFLYTDGIRDTKQQAFAQKWLLNWISLFPLNYWKEARTSQNPMRPKLMQPLIREGNKNRISFATD